MVDVAGEDSQAFAPPCTTPALGESDILDFSPQFSVSGRFAPRGIRDHTRKDTFMHSHTRHDPPKLAANWSPADIVIAFLFLVLLAGVFLAFKVVWQ